MPQLEAERAGEEDEQGEQMNELPSHAESVECDASWRKYLLNLNGVWPSPSEAFRAAWFQSRRAASPDSVDAARYRHLRNLAIGQTGQPGQPCIAMPNGMKSGYYLTEETADHAVDCSMKEANG
jgi:hypothetical protein